MTFYGMFIVNGITCLMEVANFALFVYLIIVNMDQKRIVFIFKYIMLETKTKAIKNYFILIPTKK
jgi:hypothetical protein